MEFFAAFRTFFSLLNSFFSTTGLLLRLSGDYSSKSRKSSRVVILVLGAVAYWKYFENAPMD